MEMDVKHRLTGPLETVRHQAEAVLVQSLLAGDLDGRELELAKQLGSALIGVQQRRNMLLGDHQNVGGGLRADVVKGDDLVVLVNDLGRQLTGDDSTE
jgi:hypothetical protein